MDSKRSSCDPESTDSCVNCTQSHEYTDENGVLHVHDYNQCLAVCRFEDELVHRSINIQNWEMRSPLSRCCRTHVHDMDISLMCAEHNKQYGLDDDWARLLRYDKPISNVCRVLNRIELKRKFPLIFDRPEHKKKKTWKESILSVFNPNKPEQEFVKAFMDENYLLLFRYQIEDEMSLHDFVRLIFSFHGLLTISTAWARTIIYSFIQQEHQKELLADAQLAEQPIFQNVATSNYDDGVGLGAIDDEDVHVDSKGEDYFEDVSVRRNRNKTEARNENESTPNRIDAMQNMDLVPDPGALLLAQRARRTERLFTDYPYRAIIPFLSDLIIQIVNLDQYAQLFWLNTLLQFLSICFIPEIEKGVTGNFFPYFRFRALGYLTEAIREKRPEALNNSPNEFLDQFFEQLLEIGSSGRFTTRAFFDIPPNEIQDDQEEDSKRNESKNSPSQISAKRLYNILQLFNNVTGAFNRKVKETTEAVDNAIFHAYDKTVDAIVEVLPSYTSVRKAFGDSDSESSSSDSDSDSDNDLHHPRKHRTSTIRPKRQAKRRRP